MSPKNHKITFVLSLGHRELGSILFTLLWGLFLGLTLIKFGNPVILDHLVTRTQDSSPFANLGLLNTPELITPREAPENFTEILYRPWSVVRGFWILAGLTILGLVFMRWKSPKPYFILALPIAWLLWQCFSSFYTVSATLTHITLLHFLACVVCFYIGWLSLMQNRFSKLLWLGLGCGLVLILWNGFNQHYGGLESLRRAIYEQPNWQQLSPDLLKRIGSNRIYSSLVYPNALAGVILLLLPSTLVVVWQASRRLPNLYRGVVTGLVAYLGVACLIWSGSKAGWLIALGMGIPLLFLLPFPSRIKLIALSAILVVGLAGFFFRYSNYFKRGATSVSARFDYWRAALQTTKSHPLLGTGPGTFSIPYKQIKDPKSEMARLTHNDYLEQASDSGIPGFLLYSSFFIGALYFLYRQRSITSDALRFTVWLGLLGWSAQGLVEFGLYIPALSWPAFSFFGWLLGTPRNDIDKLSVSN